MKTMFVGNLPPEATEDEVKELFSQHGNVRKIELPRDIFTGRNKGFAFIEMPRQGDARAAIKNLNYKEVDGNRIRVKKAESKQAPDNTVTSRADTDPHA